MPSGMVAEEGHRSWKIGAAAHLAGELAGRKVVCG